MINSVIVCALHRQNVTAELLVISWRVRRKKKRSCYPFLFRVCSAHGYYSTIWQFISIIGAACLLTIRKLNTRLINDRPQNP